MKLNLSKPPIFENVQSSSVRSLFVFLALLFMLIPVFNLLSDILTQQIVHTPIYPFIQNFLVPLQVRLIAIVLTPLNLSPQIYGQYLALNTAGGKPFLIEVAWNCVGWQSTLFFVITAFILLQGDAYTFASKSRALVVGFLGTFWINILRISIVSIVALWFGHDMGAFVHTHAATIIVLVWFLVFWKFSFKFMLEEQPTPKTGLH